MTLTLEEILERVIQQYDPEDIIEALEITTEELLDVPYFVDKFTINRYKFEDMEDDFNG